MSDDAALERLDDAALRGIAYGRADSDNDRMRAQRAARILADRASRTPASASRPTSTVDPAPQQSGPEQLDAHADDGSDDPPGWWRSPWRLGAVALTVGVAVGVAAGVGIPAAVDATAPDSLAVFDRPATPLDDGQLEQ
ncbi:MAG TPA: hypothetical protein VFM95_05720, partial [Microcella sp.]|nr:hypothetical protein [Microcella sp.]